MSIKSLQERRTTYDIRINLILQQ